MRAFHSPQSMGGIPLRQLAKARTRTDKPSDRLCWSAVFPTVGQSVCVCGREGGYLRAVARCAVLAAQGVVSCAVAVLFWCPVFFCAWGRCGVVPARRKGARLPTLRVTPAAPSPRTPTPARLSTESSRSCPLSSRGLLDDPAQGSDVGLPRGSSCPG